MVIDESESEAEQQEKPSAGDMVAGSAYQTAMTSVDGMRRDDKGRLKFNKNTKRGRALEVENDTDVLQDIMAEEPPKKKKAKKEVEKLGGEFRSKVCLVPRISCITVLTFLCLRIISVLEEMSSERGKPIHSVMCLCPRQPSRKTRIRGYLLPTRRRALDAGNRRVELIGHCSCNNSVRSLQRNSGCYFGFCTFVSPLTAGFDFALRIV